MISNPSTAVPETPQAARQAALNAVLRRLVAAPPPARGGPRPVPPRPADPPPAPAPHAPVPRWLTAPVLWLPIPASPLAAGTVATPPTPPPPEPEAAASEVFEVPPLVEPVAEAKPEAAAPDLVARNMSEIAAIVAEAPEAIAPVAVDLSAVTALDRPAEAPAPSAASRPAPASRTRTEPARRVAVRRARPRVGRPQRRAAAPPAKRDVAAKLSDRLDRVGGTAKPVRPHPAPAATRPAPKSSAPPSTAKAPASERPALAPAATAVARLPRTAPPPSAVPETRPLTQNRRLYRRVRLIAELEVAGKPCRLIDLSIGGFAAAGADRLDPGMLVPVMLKMTIDGINIGTQFSARMVYGNGARAAGRFVDLTGAQTAFLRYIVTWRGEAIGAVGTTTLLDAITRWPERAFQPHPSTVKEPPPERPGFWSRLVSRIPLLGWRRRD